MSRSSFRERSEDEWDELCAQASACEVLLRFAPAWSTLKADSTRFTTLVRTAGLANVYYALAACAIAAGLDSGGEVHGERLTVAIAAKGAPIGILPNRAVSVASRYLPISYLLDTKIVAAAIRASEAQLRLKAPQLPARTEP